MSSPETTFPPGFPPNFPSTNLIWHASNCPGSVFSPTISPSPEPQQQQDEYLLLYIPGNPGMIGYYRTFLSRLSVLLREGKRTKAVSILGISHAGFYAQGGREAGNMVKGEPGKGVGEDRQKLWGYTDWTSHPQPWTLQQQLKMKAELLNWIGEWYRRRSGGRKLKVLLAAHSLGAWVVMEMLKSLKSVDRLVDRLGEGEWGIRCTVDVLGGALLFPTVVDIAKSKNGRMAMPILSLHASIPRLVQIFASFLFHIVLSASLGQWLVGRFTGFSALSSSPVGSASTTNDALDTTLSFLIAPGAVEQSLSMAREEMQMIKEDTWDDELWGTGGGLQWVLYFGQRDHWVCDESRDRLIKSRGRRYVAGIEPASPASTGVERGANGNVVRRDKFEEVRVDVELQNPYSTAIGTDEEWKPRMIVCEEGIPHGFCIEYGEVMAEKVAVWIADIIERS